MKLQMNPGYNVILVKLASSVSDRLIPLGLALDAIRIITDSLEECSERLENKLLAISKKFISVVENEGAKERGEFIETTNQNIVLDKEINSALTDTWLLIDSVNRLYNIIKEHLPEMFSKHPTLLPEFESIHSMVAGVRNMYQHLDEKLKDYFGTTDNQSDCLYGKIKWYYRNSDIAIQPVINPSLTIVQQSTEVTIKDDIFEIIPSDVIVDFIIEFVKPINKRRVDKKTVYDYKQVIVNVNDVLTFTDKILNIIVKSSNKTLIEIAKNNTETVDKIMNQNLMIPTQAFIFMKKGETGGRLSIMDYLYKS